MTDGGRLHRNDGGTPAIVGRCKCGGYGFVYDDATEKRLGVCHDTANSLRKREAADHEYHARP